MMINHNSYQAAKDLSGPSQSDEDGSDESRSKSIPHIRPFKPEKHTNNNHSKSKIEKPATTNEEAKYSTMSNNDVAMEIIIKYKNYGNTC